MSGRLLLVEDVFLLGHDDESGKNTSSGGESVLAGALVLDLAEQEAVTVEDGKVVPTGVQPAHPLLRRAVEAVREREKPADVSHWLYQLPRALKPFSASIGTSLVERGILGEERGKVLGLFPTTRWPELDPEPERHLRAELREALLGEAEPSTRVLLLVALLHPHHMIDGLVDKPERKQARARARELVEIAESEDAIAKAVGDSTRAAIMAATVTATTTATSAAVIASTT